MKTIAPVRISQSGVPHRPSSFFMKTVTCCRFNWFPAPEHGELRGRAATGADSASKLVIWSLPAASASRRDHADTLFPRRFLAPSVHPRNYARQREENE